MSERKLVGTGEMFKKALAGGYAIGAYNVNNMEILQGIAEAAEGGMRDALSILDQASVYAENEISIEDVNAVTGNISNYKLIELIKAFNNENKKIKVIDL